MPLEKREPKLNDRTVVTPGATHVQGTSSRAAEEKVKKLGVSEMDKPRPETRLAPSEPPRLVEALGSISQEGKLANPTSATHMQRASSRTAKKKVKKEGKEPGLSEKGKPVIGTEKRLGPTEPAKKKVKKKVKERGLLSEKGKPGTEKRLGSTEPSHPEAPVSTSHGGKPVHPGGASYTKTLFKDGKIVSTEATGENVSREERGLSEKGKPGTEKRFGPTEPSHLVAPVRTSHGGKLVHPGGTSDTKTLFTDGKKVSIEAIGENVSREESQGTRRTVATELFVPRPGAMHVQLSTSSLSTEDQPTYPTYDADNEVPDYLAVAVVVDDDNEALIEQRVRERLAGQEAEAQIEQRVRERLAGQEIVEACIFDDDEDHTVDKSAQTSLNSKRRMSWILACVLLAGGSLGGILWAVLKNNNNSSAGEMIGLQNNSEGIVPDNPKKCSDHRDQRTCDFASEGRCKWSIEKQECDRKSCDEHDREDICIEGYYDTCIWNNGACELKQTSESSLPTGVSTDQPWECSSHTTKNVCDYFSEGHCFWSFEKRVCFPKPCDLIDSKETCNSAKKTGTNRNGCEWTAGTCVPGRGGKQRQSNLRKMN